MNGTEISYGAQKTTSKSTNETKTQVWGYPKEILKLLWDSHRNYGLAAVICHIAKFLHFPII